ncbi:MAG: RNA polymerase sigma factor [Clostridia bacterium]|nr:RNA polymerase sigma factor [Clostridia bacterium]
MTDREIVSLYHSRDESAIRETESKYGRYLFGVARNLLDSEDSRECVNDTYLRAWNAMPPHMPQFLRTFLGRITRALAIDRIRAMNSVRRAASVYAVSLEELAECVGDGDTPEDTLENKRLAEALNLWLDSLSVGTRQIFVRRYYYFDPLREIAADLGASEAKVKSALHRARLSLREYLEREDLL